MRHSPTGRIKLSASVVAVALVMMAFGGRVLAMGGDPAPHEANVILRTSFIDDNDQIVSIYLSLAHSDNNYLSVSRYPLNYGSGFECSTYGADALMPDVEFRVTSVRVSGIVDPNASALGGCFGWDVPINVFSYDLTFTPAVLTHSHGMIITNTIGQDARENRLAESTLDVWESYAGAAVSGVFDGVTVDTEVLWMTLRYGDFPAWD
jgi:hypothetical protein